jgi:L-lactate utilization protein LutC
MNDADLSVLDRVRRALGRTHPLTTPPEAPALDEPTVRLVHTDLGLGDLFARRAAEMNIGVTQCYVEELADRIVAFLQSQNVRRLMLSDGGLLAKLDLPQSLRQAGFDLKLWSEMSLDEAYDLDAAVTDVWRAVAETGSLVVRASPQHGRALSLVPFIHVAVVEPRNLLPDLLDLFELLAREGPGSATTLITGPSKTADIEMNVVTGVHGPNVVHAFVLM